MKKAFCALSIFLAASALAQAGERSLVLQGAADPKLGKIEVTTTFTTNSIADPFCSDLVMMILVPKSVTKTVAATIDADGRYSVEVPLKGHLDWDYLNICRASPSSILISVADSDVQASYLVDTSRSPGASKDLADVPQIVFTPNLNEEGAHISLDGSEPGPFNVDLVLDSSQR